MQRLRTPVPGHHSFHSALSSYGLFAPFALWRLSGEGPEEFPGIWGSMVFRHAPIPRKGRVATTTTTATTQDEWRVWRLQSDLVIFELLVILARYCSWLEP